MSSALTYEPEASELVKRPIRREPACVRVSVAQVSLCLRNVLLLITFEHTVFLNSGYSQPQIALRLHEKNPEQINADLHQ